MKSTFLLSLIVLAASARASDGRPVRNSFIDRPVGEVSDLVAHVKADRIVADRYRRHFSMDQTTLLSFLSGLHRGRLKGDGIYTIYSVPQGGRLKMHVGRIRRGEAMFFNRAGQPTLVAKCGNPIVLGPSRSRSQKGNPFDIVRDEDAKARTMELPVAQLAEAALEPTLALEPSLPTSAVAVATTFELPVALTGDVVPVTATGAGAGSFLASLSFLASFATTFTPGQGDQRQAAPVPEPASILMLALGAGGLLQRSRRRS